MTPDRYAFLRHKVEALLPPSDASDVLALMEYAWEEAELELADGPMVSPAIGNRLRSLLFFHA